METWTFKTWWLDPLSVGKLQFQIFIQRITIQYCSYPHPDLSIIPIQAAVMMLREYLTRIFFFLIRILHHWPKWPMDRFWGRGELPTLLDRSSFWGEAIGFITLSKTAALLGTVWLFSKLLTCGQSFHEVSQCLDRYPGVELLYHFLLVLAVEWVDFLLSVKILPCPTEMFLF